MKILISTDQYTYQVNGVTNSVLALKSELIKLGHDVRVLALSPNHMSFVENNDYFIGSSHIPVYPDAHFTFKMRDKLIDNIIDWHPDIVHIQTEFSTRRLALKIAKKLNIPYVHTCHTLYEDYIHYFCPSKKLGKFIVKKLSNKYYNSSKYLIVPSSKLKNKMDEYGIKCPIEVIPTGIELEKYQKVLSKKDKNKLYEELNLSSDYKYLVTVCRIAKEKNIDEIIRYLKNLIEKNNNIKLIIVGDGPYKKKLEKIVDKMNLNEYVIFTGMIKQNDIYKYYKLGDIFLSASTSETQGLTYIEALANGLALVCKSDECLNGVIENGKNGFIYNNEEEFIKSITTIFDNKLEKKMGNFSLRKSNKFSKKYFGKKMEKLYKSVLKKSI